MYVALTRVYKTECGDLARIIVESDEHMHDCTWAIVKDGRLSLKTKGLSLTLVADREFVCRQLACFKEGKLIIATEPKEIEHVDYGCSIKSIRGYITTLTVLEDIPSAHRDGKKQCKMTYLQFMDSGGLIPDYAIKAMDGIYLTMEIVKEMRDAFNRDEEVSSAPLGGNNGLPTLANGRAL